MTKVLVTGAAGFIGMHTAQLLAAEGYEVIGLDNINTYYEIDLKYARLKNLGISKEHILYNKEVQGESGFKFVELNLEDAGNLIALFAKHQFDVIVHLAAQAGVRYSITNPRDYINSNINGFFNVLEACRTFPVKHLLFASSSSVYGNSTEVPFTEDQQTDSPISLYAATKKANELFAFTYSHLYGIPCTGLRFFTVYGPWGRPDMAYFMFTKAILEGKPISVYANGLLKRDFTYVEALVKGLQKLLESKLKHNLAAHPYQILNIGNSEPVMVMDMIYKLENILGKKAIIHYQPPQPGDVDVTYADITLLQNEIDYDPHFNLDDGLRKFADWYRAFYDK
jgi:UDP-glucuronate 4-epimerase